MKNFLQILVPVCLIFIIISCQSPVSSNSIQDLETPVMEEETKDVSTRSYRSGYRPRRLSTTKGSDISVGSNGAVFMIGKNYGGAGGSIYKWSGTKWNWIHGKASRISVDPQGNPWVVTGYGDIFKGDGNGNWTDYTKITGQKAYDIDVSPDGTVYIIGQRIKNGGGICYKLVGNKFIGLLGSGLRIAGGYKGAYFYIDMTNTVYHVDEHYVATALHDSWRFPTENYKAIDLAYNARCLVAVGTNGIVSEWIPSYYSFNDGYWYDPQNTLLTNLLDAIDIAPDLDIFSIKTNNDAYEYY